MLLQVLSCLSWRLNDPSSPTIDLKTFIVSVFCLTDDLIRRQPQKLRQRRLVPMPADSEVLTMAAVGDLLDLATDQGLCPRGAPGLTHVHRTTFLRQTANLWPLIRALWQQEVRFLVAPQ